MDTVWTEREVLTVPQVADYLGIGETKCWELVNSGSIQSFRPGGRLVRIRKAELLDWIGRREKEAKVAIDPYSSGRCWGRKYRPGMAYICTRFLKRKQMNEWIHKNYIRRGRWEMTDYDWTEPGYITRSLEEQVPLDHMYYFIKKHNSRMVVRHPHLTDRQLEMHAREIKETMRLRGSVLLRAMIDYVVEHFEEHPEWDNVRIGMVCGDHALANQIAEEAEKELYKKEMESSRK
jgi:excisionase family DNA binding protein